MSDEQPAPTLNLTASKTYLTITPDGRVVLGDDITMDEAAEQLLIASSAYVARLEATTERADRLEAAGNEMAEAIGGYLEELLTEMTLPTQETVEMLEVAEDRWRALVGAGEDRS